MTYTGLIAPKIIQLEDMLVASATFLSATGALTAAAGRDHVHYDYALLDEEGVDPALGLLRLVDLLPCAVILSAEQLQYMGVTYGSRHRLRAEGAFGLLLLAADVTNGDVDAQSQDKRKAAVLAFDAFHRGVIEDLALQAGVVDGVTNLPIDQINLDVPPTRSHPYLDAADAADPGEFRPFWLAGYTIHWK